MDFIIKIFGMGQSSSAKKVNFEDIQNIIQKKRRNFILINTLPNQEQSCLIQATISSLEEEKIINAHLNKDLGIVIYAANSNDETLLKKYQQLLDLGFTRVFIYPGGLFEWLLLQDIYGKEEFPTTIMELDILKYKPKPKISTNNLLENID